MHDPRPVDYWSRAGGAQPNRHPCEIHTGCTGRWITSALSCRLAQRISHRRGFRLGRLSWGTFFPASHDRPTRNDQGTTAPAVILAFSFRGVTPHSTPQLAALSIIITMNPDLRRDLARLGQLDHVRMRRVSPTCRHGEFLCKCNYTDGRQRSRSERRFCSASSKSP